MSQSQYIFVLDDEAAARDMIGDYLNLHGFAVTLCDGGLGADDYLAKPCELRELGRPLNAASNCSGVLA
jgi:DNA-binding response OmpR family regulator